VPLVTKATGLVAISLVVILSNYHLLIATILIYHVALHNESEWLIRHSPTCMACRLLWHLTYLGTRKTLSVSHMPNSDQTIVKSL
jgi:hypothetical protein